MLSLRALCAHLHGEPLEPIALAALATRTRERATLAALVESGAFRPVDATSSVFLGILTSATDDPSAELLISLLPAAIVIVSAVPYAGRPAGTWLIRTRLGAAAPDWLTFNEIDPGRYVDPHWGGRWNAGSNRRGGGTRVEPAEWAARFGRRVNQLLAERRQCEKPSAAQL